MFSNENNCFLVEQILTYFDKYHEKPSYDTLVDVIKDTNYRDKGGLITTLRNLPECGDLNYIRDKILAWVKWTAIDQVLQSFSFTPNNGLDPKLLAKEIDKSSRIGDDLLMNHTKLDVDQQESRNKVVRTPWRKLDYRLNGGIEVGDLGIILTVVSGGKTTVLVNIAVSAICQGLFVVYFTFEDGEAKIKRRLMQCIANKTISEMIDNPQEARQMRDKVLSKTSGRCEIKQVTTRTTKISDVISFVRSLEETQGRKVDVIITDYADRFCPPNRRSEPRHEYREIFESCKAAAGLLKVVHWTASQVNKTRMGKEIVSVEDVSEAYGKVESADIVLGFGQTLEDEQLERITLYTAKMRDASRHEKILLGIDFGRQRLWELE